MWQFGVVVWEILTGAKYTPFHNFTSVLELTNHLISSGSCTLLQQLNICQLSQLKVISQKLSPILEECWDFNPKARPTFLGLHSTINGLSSVERQDGSTFVNGNFYGYNYHVEMGQAPLSFLPSLQQPSTSSSLNESVALSVNPYIFPPKHQGVKRSNEEI